MSKLPKGKEFIQKYFKIRTKKGELVTIKFNNAQNKLYDIIADNYNKKPGRYIILKARQLGISTFTEAMITYLTMYHHNTDSVIIAHDSTASSNIYSMTKLYVAEVPDVLRPTQKYSNAKLLTFDNDKGTGLKSSIRVAVANDSTRGQTYRYAHLSEVAFWDHPDTAMLSILQCIPNENDTICIIESTANGFNYFYDMWNKAVKGENDFIPIFFAWYMDSEYVAKYDGFILTPYEEEIKEKFNLINEQLAWRRWAIKNQCGGDENLFRQEYPITPEEAFITSGTNVFNTQTVLSRMKSLDPPIKVGCFEYDYDGLHVSNIRWKDDPQGFIRIYTDVTDGNYAIGGDTAGDGTDYFVAQVLDKNGNQVATLHHQFDEDLYTKQVYCLGMYYNTALLGIEANFSSFPNRELQRLGYPNLYLRETFDQIGADWNSKYGFMTTSRTRPMILAQLVEVFREEINLINDYDTLNEALSFVWLDGKQQASVGSHDDLIMGLAIAYEILKRLPQSFKGDVDEDYKDEELALFDYEG